MKSNIDILNKFIKAIKDEFKDQNWDYLNFIAERVMENEDENTPKMESWEKQLEPIILAYRGEGEDEEPLDGDAVDRLCEIIKAKINLHEGNITEDEYEKELG